MRLDPRLRPRFDSSDVIQETMQKALKDLDDFHGTTEAELLGWLRTILKSTVIDLIRRHKGDKRDVRVEEPVRAVVDESSAWIDRRFVHDGPSPSEHAAQHEMLERLMEAAEQLDDAQREVFVLRDVEGSPVAQVAERLGKTEKAVAGLLARARQRLRELMGDGESAH
jgi:RNA polymerase sigma-70 factor (ECF subfamily)